MPAIQRGPHGLWIDFEHVASRPAHPSSKRIYIALDSEAFFFLLRIASTLNNVPDTGPSALWESRPLGNFKLGGTGREGTIIFRTRHNSHDGQERRPHADGRAHPHRLH